ncbi:MAG TPA: zinc ribbon domain-containing protein [Candidatus Sulfotelmatobacter sp.]|nr:zinc ribbon domain-containing protein [Candidatus Sulfotelmatobacter sp.]
MNCPFCDEEIKDKALVCKHCGRDLSLLRPVLDRFLEMENRLASLEEALHTLGAHVDSVKSGQAAPLSPKTRGRSLLPHLPPAVAIILLIASHWLIIGILDINPWVLRLVSILLPLPFGWFHARSVAATLAAAAVIATVSIYGMLVSTSLIDHVPVLPQTPRDWLEIAEYAASIGLSYLTGSLLGGWMKSRRASAQDETSLVYEIAAVLASKSAPKGETRAKSKLRIEIIVNYLNIFAVLLTAAGSIVTGIMKFLPSAAP